MNTQIREEAAEWVVEFRTGDADATAREQFAAWLSRSPEHVRAYLELVAFWEDAGLYDSQRKLDVELLVAHARSDDNVIPLEFGPRATARPAEFDRVPAIPPVRRSWRIRLATIVASMLAIVAVGTGAWVAFHSDPTYATELGEQRSVRLEDGSRVELNAVSRIRVHYSPEQRTIELLTGQALFSVAKNSRRPFVVISGDTRVRALGTQFDVNRTRSSTVVTVLEGRVALSSNSGPTLLSEHSASAAPVEVAAGEQVTVTASDIAEPAPANLATATAWTRQRLIFESTPLAQVADEFNRFNTRHLVIGSPELADFRVSGTFPALDPSSLERFVRFLRAQPGIQVVESGDRIVVTQKQG